MPLLHKHLSIHSKYYREILAILQKTTVEARIVGGSVRDSLIGKVNLDIDITTSLPPNEVISILEQHNIKAIPTGLKFGGVTAIYREEKFEITTLRKDMISDGRHAVVEYTTSFEEDARRRDFTINALSYCELKGIVYDYFTGFSDLEANKVRFIGNPHDRIKEDFLRILRFFRFSAYYAKEIDPDGLAASIDLCHHLPLLSKERIRWELDKIILSDNCQAILTLMLEQNILTSVFPKTSMDNLHALGKALNYSRLLNLSLSLNARYAILFAHSLITILDLIDYKLARAEASQIIKIIQSLSVFSHYSSSFMLDKIWYEENDYPQFILTWFAYDKINMDQANNFLLSVNQLKPPIFPVSGEDFKNKGYAGKDLGVLLKNLKEEWINQKFNLSKTQLLSLVKDYQP